MKRKMFTGYLIGLHLLLALFLWKPDFLSRVKARLGGTPGAVEFSKFYEDMRRYHARSAGIIPEGSVFFIGASIIQGLSVEAVVHPAVNYGIGGDTTEGVLRRLDDYVMERASAVVLSIGGNDLKFRSPEAAAANVEKILSRIRPGLPVILSAVLPVDESARENLQGRNAAIEDLNNRLQQVASQSSRVTWVDHPNLTAKGQLRPELHDGDGVHPNNKGNRLLADNFRAALLRAKSPPVP